MRTIISLAKFASIAATQVKPCEPPNIFGKSLQGNAVAGDLIWKIKKR